jgi:hypothetical protein
MINFSGSYSLEDVQILLKPIKMPVTPISEKEYWIQSEQKHYSEMISEESLPSAEYLALFYKILALNRQRLAIDLLTLASKIHYQKHGVIVLVSLARAGTPIGILLKRILQNYFNRQCYHYSISIIRERGIDTQALNYILNQHSNPNALTFVDGWTGKGVIAKELNTSIRAFNQQYGSTISADLYVLNDIAGVATVSASFEDYLIPSSLLNSTISGLISRSILNKNYIQQGDFHGCIYYQEFEKYDISQWFINQVMTAVAEFIDVFPPINPTNKSSTVSYREQSDVFISQLKKQYNIFHVNLIKPGIGEATRVLLRRSPYLLILKNLQAEETAHLVMLATQKNIPIIENLTMPYQAVAIIAEIHHD